MLGLCCSPWVVGALRPGGQAALRPRACAFPRAGGFRLHALAPSPALLAFLACWAGEESPSAPRGAVERLRTWRPPAAGRVSGPPCLPTPVFSHLLTAADRAWALDVLSAEKTAWPCSQSLPALLAHGSDWCWVSLWPPAALIFRAVVNVSRV